MFKPTDTSTPMNVSLWLISACLVMFLTLAGSPSSMAGSWADRAMARRTARAERTELRDRPRQAEPTDDAGTVSMQLTVLAPENALRPGVVRRLARRGISVEELEALTRGGQPQQFSNGQGSARPFNQYGYQTKTRSDAGFESVLDSGKTEQSLEPRAGVMTSNSGRPQQPVGPVPTESRSILVGAEDSVSSSPDEGPRFPGMEGEQTKTRDTPVVTHEPIELLPTPKPAE
ncbi:MAG: hypothetical protein ACR2NI_11530 [Pirellulales bacterium]